MAQTVTNPLVQMAWERRAGTTRARSCPAFRLGCPLLLTNRDGFSVLKSVCVGGEGGRETGEGGGGEGRGVVKTLRCVRHSGGRERGERGRRVLGDSLGDVVLGYPRPGSDAGEPGRGADCSSRHATRAPAAQGEWSIATSGTVR